jgi:hypothetical protein
VKAKRPAKTPKKMEGISRSSPFLVEEAIWKDELTENEGNKRYALLVWVARSHPYGIEHICQSISEYAPGPPRGTPYKRPALARRGDLGASSFGSSLRNNGGIWGRCSSRSALGIVSE